MLPLEGLLVVDLSRILAGPFCAMRLGDLGARVIKVESPDGDDTRRFGPPFLEGESTYFMAFNHGKESVALDLKSDVGRAILERLVARADVLVENFRPGSLERLGFGADRLAILAPRLVRVTVSGYGSSGPRAGEAAFDLAVQAESGLMRMNGPPGSEPCRVPFSAADVAAGVTASEHALAALLRRERIGAGAHVEVSLLDALVSFFGFQAQAVMATGRDPRPMGHRHPSLAPYQVFATADGELVLAVATDAQWRRLITLEGMPPGLDAERWRRNADRVADREALVPKLEAAFLAGTTDEWAERLAAADVPFGALKGLGETLEELRTRGDGFVCTRPHAALGTVPRLGGPALLDGVRGTSARGAPLHGEHTAAVIRELARDEDEAASWLAACDAASPRTEGEGSG